MDAPGRRFITVAEAGIYLSLHPMTVRKMIARSEIPCVRLGRAVRVDFAELERRLEGQQRKSCNGGKS